MQSPTHRMPCVAYVSSGGGVRIARLLEEFAAVVRVDDPAQLERGAAYGVLVLELAALDVATRTTIRFVRERGSMPILVAASLEPAQRAAVLADGADEIVPADVDGVELRHHVAALARRQPRASRTGELRYRDVSLAVDRRLVRRGSRAASLTPKEEALLRTMLRRPARVLSASELFRAMDLARDSHGTLQAYIYSVRRKLNHPGEQPYVTTIRGNGYVFDTGAR